jgi:hypothetical protein
MLRHVGYKGKGTGMLLHVLPLVLAMSGQAPPQQAPPPQQVRPAIAVARQAPRKIYNETADAKAQIETALKGAAEDDIRVLINWGANDDENCSKFQTAMRAEREASTKLSNEYKVVAVDVGHLDKNQDLAHTYGAALAPGALPYLTVLDKAGKVIAAHAARDFNSDDDPAAFDSKKILAFLTEHQVPSPDARPLLDAAVGRAKREDKHVFVWFSAPW